MAYIMPFYFDYYELYIIQLWLLLGWLWLSSPTIVPAENGNCFTHTDICYSTFAWIKWFVMTKTIIVSTGTTDTEPVQATHTCDRDTGGGQETNAILWPVTSKKLLVSLYILARPGQHWHIFPDLPSVYKLHIHMVLTTSMVDKVGIVVRAHFLHTRGHVHHPRTSCLPDRHTIACLRSTPLLSSQLNCNQSPEEPPPARITS